MQTQDAFDHVAFGQRFALALKWQGMSQREAAQALGCSASFVSDVVRGLKAPGAEFLGTAHATLGVSLDWLLLGLGSPRGGFAVALPVYGLWLALARMAEAAHRGSQLAGIELSKLAHGSEDVAVVNQFARPDDPGLLAARIYNAFIDEPPLFKSIAQAAAMAQAFFGAYETFDATQVLQKDNPAPNITNIGRSVRSAGRDFHESTKAGK